MTMNDVNSTIELLCEKFGTTVEFLVPAIIKYEISVGTTILLICLFFIIASLIVLKIFYNKYKIAKEKTFYSDEDFICTIIMICAGITLGFSTLIFTLVLPNYIGFLISPYGAVVNMILN